MRQYKRNSQYPPTVRFSNDVRDKKNFLHFVFVSHERKLHDDETTCRLIKKSIIIKFLLIIFSIMELLLVLASKVISFIMEMWNFHLKFSFLCYYSMKFTKGDRDFCVLVKFVETIGRVSFRVSLLVVEIFIIQLSESTKFQIIRIPKIPYHYSVLQKLTQIQFILCRNIHPLWLTFVTIIHKRCIQDSRFFLTLKNVQKMSSTAIVASFQFFNVIRKKSFKSS